MIGKSATILLIASFSLLAPSSLLFAAPTAITTMNTMAFGTFIGGGGAAGTVTINTSGARTSSGGVVLLNSAYAAAGFTITGNGGRAYTLTIPASFTISSGSSLMDVTAVTASIPLSGTLPVSGTLAFTVGGTLNVTASQTRSTYSGTLAVTVK